MSRHTSSVIDLLDGIDDADEHDHDLLVELLGLAGTERDPQRPGDRHHDMHADRRRL